MYIHGKGNVSADLAIHGHKIPEVVITYQQARVELARLLFVITAENLLKK